MVDNVLIPLAIGLFIGLIYDIFRLFRLITNSRFFFDFLFWIISAFIVFTYYLSFKNGSIRTYYILEMLYAFLVYIFTVARLTVHIEQGLAKAIKSCLKILVETLKKFLHYIYNIYYNIRGKIGRFRKSKEGKENVKAKNERG